jgi:hypothetical protein
MTVAKQIRAFKAANPEATNLEVAKAVNTSKVYVSQTLNNYKKPKKDNLKPVVPSEGQKVLRNEIQRLNDAIARWESLSKFQDAKIGVLTQQNKALKEHHAGLEYVISYLESRLGIEKKEDGPTV